MVRTVRAGRRRRRSPELAGRPPAGGGTAVARPPTVADGRTPRPCPSPAYVFFPQRWSEPSEPAVDEEVCRGSPDGRQPVVVPPPTVVAERIHRPWPSSAYIFPRKYGPIRPKRGLAGKVRRTSPDHRRRAVAGYFFGPWGWWPIEITAYGLRGP